MCRTRKTTCACGEPSAPWQLPPGRSVRPAGFLNHHPHHPQWSSSFPSPPIVIIIILILSHHKFCQNCHNHHESFISYYWFTMKGTCVVNWFIFHSRFEKCLKMGMKLEAIREDRTRGGRSTYQVLSSEFVFINCHAFFCLFFHTVSLSSSCVIFSSHDDIFLVLVHNSPRVW